MAVGSGLRDSRHNTKHCMHGVRHSWVRSAIFVLCDLRQVSPLSFSFLLCEVRVGRGGCCLVGAPRMVSGLLSRCEQSRRFRPSLPGSGLMNVREDVGRVLAGENLGKEAGLS